MCGIAGIISAKTSLVQLPLLKKMSGALAHRGPDGEGHWISRQGQAGLAHRRLKIIDLSESAAQPMHYLDIVTNRDYHNAPDFKLCNEIFRDIRSSSSNDDSVERGMRW